MTENLQVSKPDLLLEASRVLNSAGPDYAQSVRMLSDLALKLVDKAMPDTRAAIVGDAAALRLRKAGQYEEALALLVNIDTPAVPDRDGRLRLLRALANGQKYAALDRAWKDRAREAPPDSFELDALRTSIREDLLAAFRKDPTLVRDNWGYWDPESDARSEPGLAEDDLKAFYQDDEMFRSLVEKDRPFREKADYCSPQASSSEQHSDK